MDTPHRESPPHQRHVPSDPDGGVAFSVGGGRSTARRRRWIIVGLVAVFAIAAPIVWHKQIRFRLMPKNFGVVVPGALYRGADQHSHVLRRICERNGIRTIVDLTGHDAAEDELCRELGIVRYSFALPGDGRGDPAKWAAILQIIADSNRQPVFIHCAAGAQRTTTAVLLYRRFVEGRTFQQAYPESFRFGHKPDEWKLMAFLADHAETIESIRRTGSVARDGEEIPLELIVSQGCTLDPD